MVDMASKVVAGLLAIVVVIAAIALIFLLLVSLPLIIAAIALIVLVVIVVVFLLLILGVLLGIPYYFLKRGPRSEEGRYDVGEVKSIKEDEKK